MSREFSDFTRFFHQDALVDGDSFLQVARMAASSMSDEDLASLVQYLRNLRSEPPEKIEDAWNNSNSDFYIRGRECNEFIGEILSAIDGPESP